MHKLAHTCLRRTGRPASGLQEQYLCINAGYITIMPLIPSTLKCKFGVGARFGIGVKGEEKVHGWAEERMCSLLQIQGTNQVKVLLRGSVNPVSRLTQTLCQNGVSKEV